MLLISSTWLLKANVARRLGLANVARVIAYRARLKLGVHPVQRVRREIGGSVFFRNPEPRTPNPLTPPTHWQDHALHFGWHRTQLSGNPPDWFENPFTGARIVQTDRPWWEVPDFESGVGDIKTVWEASRFDWVLVCAQRAAGGDADSLARLNTWLADWCDCNPCFKGPNWKCGQEASIRVMHLLLAARFLNQLDVPEPPLVQLIEAHLARIEPTLAYSMAQDNNHGTSEAAALFIGGDWCMRHGAAHGAGWASTGRRWLENRVERLIEPDGGFSQYSVNYHRLMLDTLSLAELWRRWHDLSAFSDLFYARARAATAWLREMTDPATGDAPNLGANDGANLLPLTDAAYRDYRPAVQLASLLFDDGNGYTEAGAHHDHVRWLELEPASGQHGEVETTPRHNFHARGYMILRRGPWKAVFRYPYYRFRPGQCDALHFDLWHGSSNLLRDAGSYGYNVDPGTAEYFNGAVGHCTVQFDDRQPMPRVSRFLYGAWLDCDELLAPEETEQGVLATAGYTDWQGARHRREIVLADEGLQVTDEVSGFKDSAVLRWRLAPGDWRMEGGVAVTEIANPRDGDPFPQHRIAISASVPMGALRLVQGWESRHYLHKQPCPVLEAEIHETGEFRTDYRMIQ